MTTIRTFFCFIILWSMSASPLLAQVKTEPAPDSAAAQTATDQASTEQLNKAVEKKTEETPTIKEAKSPQTIVNLDDPAVKAALEAREEADQALIEAIRAQQAAQNTAGQFAEQNSDASGGKESLFPKQDLDIKAIGEKTIEKLLGWLTSIPFLAQIGAIILAYFMAPILAGFLKKRLFLFASEPAKDVKFKPVRDVLYRARGLLRPIFLVALLAVFAVALKNIPIAGQDWLVKLVQGLAVVFLLFSAIKDFAPNDLIRKTASWIVIPLALLMVFGYYDDLITSLNNLKFGSGDNAISAMTFVKLAIFGALFFKLGSFSNSKGQEAIRSQETLDITTREVVAKIFQIVVFGAVVMLALTAAGISLSGLVVIFSALSLGIGLGLQPIAANFVSGMIILFDRSVKVGDFIMTDDEKFGRVKAINMRSTTVSTADGKDIIVPNTSFTEGAYENWTHDSPLQRYEVDFGVAYDTDLDALVPIIRDAVLEHPDVLAEPDLPSVEFRAFGDSSINMCVEFWCEGVDDGPNKFTSDVGFIIWRTLKAHNIEIPFPQRVIHSKK